MIHVQEILGLCSKYTAPLPSEKRLSKLKNELEFETGVSYKQGNQTDTTKKLTFLLLLLFFFSFLNKLCYIPSGRKSHLTFVYVYRERFDPVLPRTPFGHQISIWLTRLFETGERRGKEGSKSPSVIASSERKRSIASCIQRLSLLRQHYCSRLHGFTLLIVSMEEAEQNQVFRASC